MTHGHSHDAWDIKNGILVPARLGSGTANSSTFLRGDGVWATPPSGGFSSGAVTLTNNNSILESPVARWTIAAGTLTAGMLLEAFFAGQFTSTNTSTLRLKIGTNGSSLDPTVATLATTAAGVANRWHTAKLQLQVNSIVTTTATIQGSGYGLSASVALGMPDAALATVTCNPTVSNYISITQVLSTATIFNARHASLERLA